MHLVAQVASVVQSLGLRITSELAPYITELGNYLLNAAREAGGFRSQIAALVEAGVHGAVAMYDVWMRLREVWSAIRIGVMYAAEKVLHAVSNMMQTGEWLKNGWVAIWRFIEANTASVIQGLKVAFSGLKVAVAWVLNGIGQAAGEVIQKLADAAGYVNDDLAASLANAAKAVSNATGSMLNSAKADLQAHAEGTRDAAEEYGQAARGIVTALTTLPEANATITQWRANLTGNMQAEVEKLNSIDEERLANIAKVEAQIIDVKTQAAKRAEEIEKAKIARVKASRTVADAETIEAERKKHVAIAGETANFFGNMEAMTAEGAEKNKALFYVNKAAAMSQAVVNAWMAYSNTLASPALISTPYLAQGFASAALAAGLVAAANIAGQSAPGRANGGPVSRGGMYEVNERGPEMLTVGDKSFLMMGGRSGHVTPGGPGGSSPKVEVHVHTPPGMAARTEQGTGEGGAPRIDVIIEQVANRMAGDIASGVGPVSKTMQNTYGLNRSRGSSR